MADYNIYIHDLSGTTQPANPTKAWTSSENSQTKAWAPQAEQESANGGMGNFTPSAAAFKGVGKAIKAHPVVAAAAAVIAIGIKVANSIEPYTTLDGDYRYSVAWNNMKAATNLFIRPISSTLDLIRTHKERDRENARHEQERMLLGDSIVNARSRRV